MHVDALSTRSAVNELACPVRHLAQALTADRHIGIGATARYSSTVGQKLFGSKWLAGGPPIAIYKGIDKEK